MGDVVALRQLCRLREHAARPVYLPEGGEGGPEHRPVADVQGDVVGCALRDRLDAFFEQRYRLPRLAHGDVGDG
jgi:hypothetical protein